MSSQGAARVETTQGGVVIAILQKILEIKPSALSRWTSPERKKKLAPQALIQCAQLLSEVAKASS